MSAKLKPIERVTASESVARQVIGLIIEGTWRPGDKLPPEQELMEKLKIGRTPVREAMAALSIVGLLETQQGRGTFIRGAFSEFIEAIAGWSALIGDRDLTNLMEVREPLEITAAGLAAERATPEDIASIHQASVDFESSENEPEAQVKADLLFHEAISRAARNPILYHIMLSLQGLMRESIVVATRVTSEQGTLAETIVGHREVLQAIRNRDPRSARQAMRKHNRCAWRVIKDGALVTEEAFPREKD